MSGADRDFWRRAIETARVLDTRSYYQVLGVADDASGPALSEAYYRLVRALHPDRYARERDPERKRALVLINARLGEAYRVLASAPLRARYDRGLAAGKKRLSPEDARESERAAATHDPKAPHVRAIYDRGLALMAAGELRAARAQLQMAAGFEPASSAIQEALAALSRLERGPEPTPAPAAAPASPPPPAGLPPQLARAHPRHPVVREIKVRCGDWAQVQTFYSRNISKGGMFLRTDEAPAKGTRLELVVSLPDGRALAVGAEVVRVVPPGEGEQRAGMGVRFVDIDPEVIAALEATLPPEPAASRAPGEAVEVSRVRAALAEELARVRTAAGVGVLGLREGATAEDLRRAYLDLARRFHPDLYRRYEAADLVEAASEITYLVRRAYDAARRAAAGTGAPR